MVDKGEVVLLTSLSNGTTARASSVLQKNHKLYGPKKAFDYENDTNCWNSEGSSSGKQDCYFIVEFERLVIPTEVRIQFQAGFSSEEVYVSRLGANANSYEPVDELEAEDEHEMQVFPLPVTDEAKEGSSALKLEFKEFTDFYGRVTIYQLQVWGHEISTK
ncbi:unnamed protein product [Cylindrotheca closterium]|uniref:SUN domain-containing protein n=1 Tax=Cylindrotheca closterium TaxID=2856 RepID=A0AAD2CRP0_9STRA|nr:unnamed protein product [Cylindrotheca closterium]